MKSIVGLIVISCVLVTTGCVGIAINGSTMALKSLPRAELEAIAETGDADAQYELGLSHCCMGVGFSTQTATEWLCKAAAQNQVDAMYELGRIYLGEISRTPAPFQKVAQAAMAQESLPHAYVWFNKALEFGHAGSRDKLDSIVQDIDPEELEAANTYFENDSEMACIYDEVFTSA